MSKYFEIKSELKPCPFCGGKAKLELGFIPTEDDEINVYFVGCDVCEISFMQDWGYDKIVEKWNTRVKNGESGTDKGV